MLAQVLKLLLLLVILHLPAYATEAGIEAKQRCPGETNQCSLHGTCIFNRQGERICNCQWGYFGDDCSKKMCPHGFNPTSDYLDTKRIKLVISITPNKLHNDQVAPFAGKFLISFHSHSVEFETPLVEMTSEACTKLFQRFHNIADVSCIRTDFKPPYQASYEISLLSFPEYPIMNNLYYHNGDPKITDFWCDTDQLSIQSKRYYSVLCKFENLSSTTVREYLLCAGHGLCNTRDGICTCSSGYYGDNCANTIDEEDILVAPSTGPFFKGNVFHITAKRESSREFNLMKVESGGVTTLVVNGFGETTFHQGAIILKPGVNMLLEHGNIDIENGGQLRLNKAKIVMENSFMDLHSSSHLLPSRHALLNIDISNTSTTATNTQIVQVAKDGIPVFEILVAGPTIVHGPLVAKKGLEIHAGLLKLSGKDGIFIENGGLRIAKSSLLLRGDGVGSFRVENAVKSLIQSSSPVYPALQISQKNPSISVPGVRSPPVFVIDSETTDASLLQLKRKDADQRSIVVFEVENSGHTVVRSGGLTVEAGGINIHSGGQRIEGGGLHVVNGGIVVENGGLAIMDKFRIEGGLHVTTDAMTHERGIFVASNNPYYGGTLLDIDVSQQQINAPPFHVIAIRSLDDVTKMSIKSDGSIRTQGDVRTTTGGKIIAGGPLISSSHLIFSPQYLFGDQIKQNNGVIRIPISHSYVKYENGLADPIQSLSKEIIFETEDAKTGQLLVLQNNSPDILIHKKNKNMLLDDDSNMLEENVNIGPTSAAMYVFDGENWQPFTSSSSDTTVLRGVKHFDAANDLNFGNIKLTVQNLQVGGMPSGFLTYFGKGGELQSHDGIKFDAARNIMLVDHLHTKYLSGRIDMTDSELRGVDIVGGHISNVNMTSIESIEIAGEMFVESSAFFGSGINVDGQVIGTGAYVDASDMRFKQDFFLIKDAMDTVTKLEGVEYSYRTGEFPSKKFPSGREFGFIAQQIEYTVPQVVTTDNDGYKYVAYARLVPLLVEAIKEENNKQKHLAAEVQHLRKELEILKSEVQKQAGILRNVLQQLDALDISNKHP